MRLGEIRQKITERFRSTSQHTPQAPKVEIVDLRNTLLIPEVAKHTTQEDTPVRQKPHEVVLIIANSNLRHVGEHVVTIPQTPAGLK